MKVVIIDYGSGNLRSAAKAFEKISSKDNIIVSDKPSELKTATHIVLPGVGAFHDCMNGVKKISGMVEELNEQVKIKNKPFLGICVGMQLLAKKGFEHGEHTGLGWLDAVVRKIEPKDKTLKVPHMGWNNLSIKKDSKLFNGIKNQEHAYFVHSYFMECNNKNDVVAETEYGENITAAVQKENIFGVQFHPEKSQELGLKLISNFISL